MGATDNSLTAEAVRTSRALADRAEADGVPVLRQRAAALASLWPAPTRQCVAAPVYLELPAPAMFGMLFRVIWPGLPRG